MLYNGAGHSGQKSVERNEAKSMEFLNNKYVKFVLYIVVFFAVWNLCDFLITKIFTGGSYQFTLLSDGGLPLIIAIASWFLLFNKKESK